MAVLFYWSHDSAWTTHRKNHSKLRILTVWTSLGYVLQVGKTDLHPTAEPLPPPSKWNGLERIGLIISTRAVWRARSRARSGRLSGYPTLNEQPCTTHIIQVWKWSRHIQQSNMHRLYIRVSFFLWYYYLLWGRFSVGSTHILPWPEWERSQWEFLRSAR